MIMIYSRIPVFHDIDLSKDVLSSHSIDLLYHKFIVIVLYIIIIICFC